MVTTNRIISIGPTAFVILLKSMVIMVIARKISSEICSTASTSGRWISTWKASRIFLAIAPAKRHPIKYGISIYGIMLKSI